MPDRPRIKAVIISRDRLDYTRQCLRALMNSAGVGDVYLVDHGSTWPPMLDWLAQTAGVPDWYEYGRLQSRVHVHWRLNQHPRDLWQPDNVLAKIITPGERFFVTDHDVVVPSDVDWLERLHVMLDDRPDAVKAGLQLRLDDLPPHLPDTQRILEWEVHYRPPRVPWKIPSAADPVGWAQASVDTTAALYRGLEPFALDPALRTIGRDFEARHLSWYEDPEHLTDEQAWYAKRAVYGHWRAPDGYEDTHGLAAR